MERPNCGRKDYSRDIYDVCRCQICGVHWEKYNNNNIRFIPECSRWNTFDIKPEPGSDIVMCSSLGNFEINQNSEFSKYMMESRKEGGYKWQLVVPPKEEK